MPTAELLFETLRLRPRTDPDDLVRSWSEARPDGLYPLADYERGAMWMQRRLTDIEAEAAAPQSFMAPLYRHAREGSVRNLLVDSEAAAVLKFLCEERIPSVLLKGVARRVAAGRFPCGDARTTSDVDLLLPAQDAPRAWEGLRERGYEPVRSAAPHHLPPLIGAGRVAVELHTAMSYRMTSDLAWERANDDAREIEWNGQRARIPSPTELLWHGLSHALQHESGAWRLRFFLDAACILAGDEPVAWQLIGERLEAGEVPPALAPRRWLDAAAQLAGAELPPGIRDGGRPFNVVRALRWRLSVLRDRQNRGLGGRLLEEGTRHELGIGVSSLYPGQSLYRRTRHRLGGLAARVVYGVWRATGARPMRI